MVCLPVYVCVCMNACVVCAGHGGQQRATESLALEPQLIESLCGCWELKRVLPENVTALNQ